jgi:alkylation response protein AidB-like acyl-CoA dehydrogenase
MLEAWFTLSKFYVVSGQKWYIKAVNLGKYICLLAFNRKPGFTAYGIYQLGA